MFSNKFRTLLFRTLNVLPESTGQAIYHQIQKALFKSVDSRVKPGLRSYEVLQTLLMNQGVSLEGKSILEIGSGWIPVMPYLLKYNGQSSDVYSYDINEHYDNKYIDLLNDHFTKEGASVEIAPNQKYHLPSFVHYHPKQDVSQVQLPPDIDLVFSRFVLEHVTPEDMVRMHRHLRNLKEGAIIAHLISPSDHRAYTDKSLSLYDFLKYSQKSWNKIQTKFDYHNRLRLPQYIEIFESAGFEVLDIQYTVPEKDSQKYRDFKQLTIHKDFADFTEEEILAASINVVLKNKKQR